MDTEKELIKSFVSNRYLEDHRQSCLVMALETARILSGRDKKTGASIKLDDCTVMPDVLYSKSPYFKHNEFGSSDNLAGLINYLLLLDLIGNVFKPKNLAKKKDGNSINKALAYFSSITDEKERWTIVALRNCLAHNYGLINIPEIPKKKKQEEIEKIKEKYQHKFCLHLNDGTKDLIKIPTTRWNGNYTDKDESTSTQIDVCKLIDAIEETYENLKEMAENGELELCLKDGEAELMTKFTIIT